MTTDKANLQDAVTTISKLSGNRILPYYEETKEGEITMIYIPVVSQNESDRKDTAMRKYMSDWIKSNLEEENKKLSVDTRWEKLPPGTSYYKENEEYPVLAKLIIQWWPRKETEYEVWLKERNLQKGQ